MNLIFKILVFSIFVFYTGCKNDPQPAQQNNELEQLRKQNTLLQERITQEKAEAKRLEKERIAKEKAEAERLEQERIAQENAQNKTDDSVGANSRAFPKKVLPKEAILQLNSGGHTALIQDILVTKSGDTVSASDDKTIRVWDSKTGKERRKILGKIGAGSGKIYAIALSPNEKFLAVGGYFENDEIRIYSYQTGKLIKILKSHENAVLDLAFSENGDYLLSSSQDNTAKLWSSESWNLEKNDQFSL
ncbi:WD40 repeat-containing protein [Thiovulum sp. ES]|nr:WD40 repeat-containing protein [Thiovulum sp. ES]